MYMHTDAEVWAIILPNSGKTTAAPAAAAAASAAAAAAAVAAAVYACKCIKGP